MDHIVCLNSNSFPAANSTVAYELFNDSLQGLLALNTGADRYILYHDSANSQQLDKFELAQELTYSDFKDKLISQGEQDLFLFLSEIEDKSPAIDYLSEDVLGDLATYSFYMPKYAVVNNPDVFGISWFLHAVLLSIPTDEQWNNHKIAIARIDDGQYIDEKLTIKNIAKCVHGQLLYEEINQVNIREVCDECFLTEDFVSWYEEQTDDNRIRVRDKLKLSCERGFNGGEPLFKNLHNGDGLREIRFSAYPGGAIRVLFKALGDSTYAILVGFVKKTNNEGYASNITRAIELFNARVKAIAKEEISDV
jgi:phage-related protein